MALLKKIQHGTDLVEFHKENPNSDVYAMHNGARVKALKKVSKVEVFTDGKPVPLKSGAHVITSVNPTCIWYEVGGVWYQYCY